MTKQLRGDALASRIKEAIAELASEAAKEGRPFVFNASKLAELVPASRTTLRRYDGVVTSELQALRAGRRTSSGLAATASLHEEVSRLRAKQEVLERELSALRRHHVEIYRQFQTHSVDVAPLIRPVLEAECVSSGRCLFCGADWKPGDSPKSNVVRMRGKRKEHGE